MECKLLLNIHKLIQKFSIRNFHVSMESYFTSSNITYSSSIIECHESINHDSVCISFSFCLPVKLNRWLGLNVIDIEH